MSYWEAERTRLRRQSSKQAVALAMQGRWREAVAANKSLLEGFPSDVDTYNRLGKAYMELGEYSLAREAYTKAVELDPHNAIAKKNLNRLSYLGETANVSADDSHEVEPHQFVEEVGKVGIVNLYQLASPVTLAKTVAGDRVNLRMNGSNLIVEDSRGEYLGQVEPKHGHRLTKLMKGGNSYTATIVRSTEEAVSVIIREMYQDHSQAGRLSFPPKGAESFRSPVGDRIIRRELDYEEALPGKPDYTIVGGEETELLSEESPDIDDEVDSEE